MSEDEAEALRERIPGKAKRLRDRRDAERLTQGWTRDETHDLMIPPGWKRAEEGDGNGQG